MSEWITHQIRDVAQVFDGPHATPEKTEDGPWFLSISSLDHGRLNLSESAHLSEEDFIRWTRRVTPESGDVLFSYETRLGDAALMPEGVQACLGRRMGLLRPYRNAVDPRFLLLAYLSPEFQGTIRSRKIHGATVDRIPLVDLPKWPIRLPILTEQRAIAAVFRALDDKIAVNEHIAMTYEQILQLHFDELGLTEGPDMDNAITASELIEFNPKTSKTSAKEAVYVDMAALSTNRAIIQTWIYREPRPGTRFSNGDTLLARITPCLENGKTGFVDFMTEGEAGIGSTEFIVMRSRPGIPRELSYFLARNKHFRTHAIRNMVGSSGRQRVSAADVANFPVNRPANEALANFETTASKAFAHIKSLEKESRTLATLRDALLPQVMSGKLRVRDAERIVEDAL